MKMLIYFWEPRRRIDVLERRNSNSIIKSIKIVKSSWKFQNVNRLLSSNHAVISFKQHFQHVFRALCLFFLFYWHNVHKQSISFFILFHTYIRHSNDLYSTICGNKNKRNNLYLSFLLSNSFKIYLTKIRVVFFCCFLFWHFGMSGNIVCFYYTQIL